VRQATGVDDDGVDGFTARSMDAVDQRALGVALEARQRRAALGGERVQRDLDLGQRGAAVGLRLAGAEQVEIRSVDDEDLHGVWLGCVCCRGTGSLVAAVTA
jgi:hypothetical protein